MTFAAPQLLLLLLLVPLGIFAASRIEERRRARAASLLGRRDGRDAGPPARGSAAVLPGALLVAGFVVLAIAVARPHANVALPRPEGTVMLTFDVSGSMAATDLPPTRMEAAAHDRVDHRPAPAGGRRGRGSSRSATRASPSTRRPATSRDILAAIQRLVPARGTSVGQGILSALDAIEKAQEDTPADDYSNRSAAPRRRRRRSIRRATRRP